MKYVIKIIFGIFLLQLFSCQEKALITDVEKMQLKEDVQFIFEKTMSLFFLDDTLGDFKSSIHNTESEFWKFDEVGNIVEHGQIIPDESSLLTIRKYSNDNSRKLTIITSKLEKIDSLVFYGNSFSRNDTFYNNLYFPDSTLYKSTKTVFDKYGREVYRHQTLPPYTPVIISYYPSGLIKNKIFTNSIYYDNSEYEYNDLNFLDKETFYKDNNISFEYSYNYTYDQNNNWVSQTLYYEGDPFQIKVRNIKYYDK